MCNLAYTLTFSQTSRPFWFAIRLTVAVISLSLIVPEVALSYVWQDDAHGTDLAIYGLGVFRLNYAAVEGNADTFAQNAEGLAENFDTLEFLSLTLEGTLYRNYALEGYLNYNQEDDADENVPDLQFNLRADRDVHYLIIGDQPDALTDLYFTRYKSPFRGLTLHVQSDLLGLTTVGALTRGTLTKETLTPNGTSGPYQLAKIPAMYQSEVISLEIRNRNNPQEVLATNSLKRETDYTIDYDDGEIRFTRPVDAETFEGNPVVIVIVYRSEQDSSAFNTALTGIRTTVNPFKWATLGVTYLSEFNRQPSFTAGFEDRKEIYGFDGAFQFGDGIKLSTEYAVSQDHLASENAGNPQHAFRADLEGGSGEKFTLKGTYRLAEKDFSIFANPDILQNQQELNVTSTYTYRPNQSFEINYRFWQDHVSADSSTPTQTTHQPRLTWQANFGEHTRLKAQYEFNRAVDDQTPKSSDSQTHSALFSVGQDILGIPLLTKLVLFGEYQMSDFADQAHTQDDTFTQQARVRVQAEPRDQVAVYVEQQEQWLRNQTLRKLTERQDTSEIGANIAQGQLFTLDTKYRQQMVYDLLTETEASKTHLLTFRSTFQPSKDLKGSAKIEWRKDIQAAESNAVVGERTSSSTLMFGGEVQWTVVTGLTMRLKYERDLTAQDLASAVQTRSDEGEFRFNYTFDQRKAQLTGSVKLERDRLESSPTPPSTTRTITYLVNGVRQLGKQWELMAQYKREVTDQGDDQIQEEILGECGYRLGQFFKLTGGYEYKRLEAPQHQDDEYQTHAAYLKLIGKL